MYDPYRDCDTCGTPYYQRMETHKNCDSCTSLLRQESIKILLAKDKKFVPILELSRETVNIRKRMGKCLACGCFLMRNQIKFCCKSCEKKFEKVKII